MAGICPKCGLPSELCVCETLEKEESKKIFVYSTSKKFKKLVTIVEGIDKNKIDEYAKKLKQKLACGGTAKDGLIILQGMHVNKVKDILVSLGFPPDKIEVSNSEPIKK